MHKRLWRRVGILTLGCMALAGHAFASDFESPVDKDGNLMALACESRPGLNGPCKFSYGKPARSETIATSFVAAQDYVVDLIRKAAQQKVAEPAKGITAPAEAVAALESARLDVKSCFTSVEMGELFVVCASPDREDEYAFLFMRGLCDRCDFESIPLKRVKK
jgi:hypothetical protein